MSAQWGTGSCSITTETLDCLRRGKELSCWHGRLNKLNAIIWNEQMCTILFMIYDIWWPHSNLPTMLVGKNQWNLPLQWLERTWLHVLSTEKITVACLNMFRLQHLNCEVGTASHLCLGRRLSLPRPSKGRFCATSATSATWPRWLIDSSMLKSLPKNCLTWDNIWAGCTWTCPQRKEWQAVSAVCREGLNPQRSSNLSAIHSRHLRPFLSKETHREGKLKKWLKQQKYFKDALFTPLLPLASLSCGASLHILNYQ